ncbi:hypothetical protein GCM10017717_29440 [Deinococcus persicinus]
MTYSYMNHTTNFSKKEDILIEFSEKIKQPSRELGCFKVDESRLFQNTAIEPFQHCLNERSSPA